MTQSEKITSSFVECLPDPVRVAEGLRDTGYEFHTAIADIVDNSIAAGASHVDIHIGMDAKNNVIVAVVDNGCGMDRDGLINAMRYGSDKRTDPSSLGKFGLGLKTASTAFCRRLSLVSKADSEADPLKATWDLDSVATRGWHIELMTPSKAETELLHRTVPTGSGTAVIWEKVDRLLGEYKNEGGKRARNALDRQVDQLRQHLRTVYQRYLDTDDATESNISISVNTKELTPWDPFCIKSGGELLAEKDVPLELEDGQKTSFKIRAYVLPRKEEFANAAQAEEARISNDGQGIFVYRQGRLIHGPDWLDMYRKEPHFSLCRIELSFDHTLDAAFRVDIKKSRIELASEIYDYLRDKFLPGPRREAEARSRKGQNAMAAGVGALLHGASNAAIHNKADALKTAKLEEVNKTTGEATITNKGGRTTLKLKILEQEKPGEVHVKTVPDLMNGVLFEPAYIAANQGVQISTSHPYYTKVYLPNRSSSVTIQGLDSLLWALCAAELGCISDDTKRKFEEMRFEVSRLLRNLVEDMPEPTEE